MSSYLRDLLTRAHDTAPVLRPRLPSRFEPDAPLPPLWENSAEQPAPAREAATRIEPISPPVTPAFRPTTDAGLEPAAPTRETPPQAATKPNEPSLPSLAIPPGRVQREVHHRTERVIEHQAALQAPNPVAHPTAPGLIQPQPLVSVPNPRPSERFAPRLAKEPSARGLIKSLPLPVEKPAALRPKIREIAVPSLPVRPVSPVHTRAPARQPESEPDTIIRVNIGRVEVRAMHAPPPPMPRRDPVLAPLLSLDDYLKQKDGRIS